MRGSNGPTTILPITSENEARFPGAIAWDHTHPRGKKFP
jgi:hypothetical protein